LIILKQKGIILKVIVPIAIGLHALIDFGISEKNINTIVSNGKRFMAYEIVKKLQEQNNEEILLMLSEAVTKSDKDRGKKHQVFERSFDCKQITSQHFFLQKLFYMHNNPCSGVWNLINNPVDYTHSSARYYINGEQGIYLIEEQ
jgi:hypothetical protein